VSTDPSGAPGGPGAGPAGTGAQPSEEELRAAYEAELSRITSADVMLQAAVSLLNIGGMRLGLAAAPGSAPGPERDLEQVREAIDGVRALLPILERKAPQELRPLRDALSQLQMAFARETGGAAPSGPATAGAPAAPGGPAAAPSTAAPAASDAQAPPTPEQAAPAPGAPPADPNADPAAGPAVSSGRLWVPGR
jgi:hypothetical protein